MIYGKCIEEIDGYIHKEPNSYSSIIFTSLLKELDEKNKSTFFSFFEFLKKEFFQKNNDIPEEIVKIIRNNSFIR
jgi:hypothetical protein